MEELPYPYYSLKIMILQRFEFYITNFQYRASVVINEKVMMNQGIAALII